MVPGDLLVAQNPFIPPKAAACGRRRRLQTGRMHENIVTDRPKKTHPPFVGAEIKKLSIFVPKILLLRIQI